MGAPMNGIVTAKNAKNAKSAKEKPWFSFGLFPGHLCALWISVVRIGMSSSVRCGE